MSLDYTYTMGYGFFIAREDLDQAGVEDTDDAVADDALDLMHAVHGGHLLNAVYANSMDSEEDKAFVAVRRSLVYGYVQEDTPTDSNPALYTDMSDFATQEELDALDAFAAKCGIEFLIPQIHFYISVT